ncbi:condensation domain-containing protein [Plantactinospora endophytica]|uniref:Condensation domain-containing protein n=1 Tax=Plantactinospora endophytica TaxID=673535 RepID=A0ABQ4E101_9ACTN|nr:condensation domain-containing protein [Plantactinospora endophytica]GIG88361.1 hypothetical protein Pen02_32970 [Plantactinospora endophytica]
MAAIRSVEITFTGARGGTAPLTWGQRSVWRWVEWLGPDETSLNLPYVLPIPTTARQTSTASARPGEAASARSGEAAPVGPELADVAAALRVLVERHESLRTVFPDGPDGPQQHVVCGGRLTVAVRNAGTNPPDEFTADVAGELAGTPFRHGGELPLRCAVVVAAGRPYAVALAVSHLAADWAALHVVEAEWTRLLTGAEPGRTPGWQPLDQAAAEAAGPVADRGGTALAYWEAGLRVAPRSLFDVPTRTPEPDRYLRLGIDSPGIAAAAELLAARCRVSTTTVLAVACTTLLATLTGHERAAVRLVSANRREPPVRDMVGKLAQDALLVLDLTTPTTLAELLRHGHQRARAGYRNGQYDPAALDRIKSRIRYERGATVDLLVFFNDIRMGQPWSGLPAPPAADGRVFVDFSTPRAHAKAFFTVEYAPDRCLLYLLADTAYLSRVAAASLLTGVETLLVHGVDEDLPVHRISVVTGISPVHRPDGWIRVGPDWLNLDAVRAVLRTATGAEDVAVAVEPSTGPAGPASPARLTGYLPDLLKLPDAADLPEMSNRSDAADRPDLLKLSDAADRPHLLKPPDAADLPGVLKLPSVSNPPEAGEVPGLGDVDVRRVHAAVMAALRGRTDVRAPDHYVICAGPPEGYPPGDAPDRWRALPRVAEGDGRATTAIPDAEDGP